MTPIDISHLFKRAYNSGIDWKTVYECIPSNYDLLRGLVYVLVSAGTDEPKIGDSLAAQVERDSAFASGPLVVRVGLMDGNQQWLWGSMIPIPLASITASEAVQEVSAAVDRLIVFGLQTDKMDSLLQEYEDITKTLNEERVKRIRWHFKKVFA